jgi:hypothetical protein
LHGGVVASTERRIAFTFAAIWAIVWGLLTVIELVGYLARRRTSRKQI